MSKKEYDLTDEQIAEINRRYDIIDYYNYIANVVEQDLSIYIRKIVVESTDKGEKLVDLKLDEKKFYTETD